MVKNLPSIERSTKIRLGKYIPEDQANNTIIFNATDALLPDTSTSNSTYIAPIRGKEVSESGTFNVLAYKTGTHEIVDTKLTTDDVGRKSLQDVTDIGSTTTHPIGLSNTNPQDTLSIGTRIFINKNSSDYGIKITNQGKLLIDGVSNGNEVQVSGTVHAIDFTGSHIGLSNTEPVDSISIGNEGQTILNVPSESVYALKTSGNLYAQNYTGDGGLLSNVTLQTVTDKSNVTSNTLLLTNPTTSLKAYSNVIVDGNIYGKIAGANTITGSIITASTQFSGPGTGLTGIPTDQFVSGSITMTSGGTGHTTYTPGTILYGRNAGDSLGQLIPAGSNADAGKFLRLDASDIPEWAEVPLTLDAVLGDTTAVSDGSMNLTGLDTTITTAGKIKAATFEGSGSDIHDINAANVVQAGSSTLATSVLPVVPVTKGGTGLNSVSTGDILYASDTDQIASLAKGTANKVLQMDSGATIPEWTSTITDATLSGPTLTGVITIPGLNNRIPFTNGIGELVSDTKLQFDGVDTMTIGSNLTVSGNLLVQGNTTFQHTQNHTISDPLIELGNANASDTIDLGVIMTRPTANVVAGYMGDEKKYVIAYTLSDPLSPHIVPTNATSDQFMTLSVEGGNVLAGNTTTTGKMTAGTLHGDSITVSGAVTGGTLVGDGSAITSLDAEKITTGAVDVDHGGTNIASYTAGDLLYATGATTLAKLGVDNGKFLKSTASAVEWADVSSTLQAITDGGATTTQTVAFNNTTTGLTSAGDIDIAATKQIDYAGDVLLKSSAGAVASLKVDNAIKLDPAYAAPSNNVLSFNTSTGEIYDSGGQGGSTLDNIHEEGSNVAIGPSAASANLTINTYGSNVLTVTGNVSADNITIGALTIAASPFGLDDVVSSAVDSNVTSNVLTLGGLVTSGNIDIAATKQIDYAGDVLLKSSAGAVASLKVDNAIKLDPAYAAPSNNVLSFNTSTGEIYDSGGQGGSTLDNIHEEGSNVAIGPSAASANLTINTYGSNVLTVTGNVSISGNTTSQNITLTNTDISATISSGTITIDAKEKTYGTAPLVISTTNVSNLVFSNLIMGAQIVVPILASGGDINISSALTNVNFYAMTTDVSITQDKHALMTLSNLYGNIYMNAIGFA